MPETPVSNLAVYRARPTLRVNQQADIRASELVVGMEMTEQEGGLSALELRFTNVASTQNGEAELAFESPNSSLTLGATLSVYAGEEDAPQEIFSGLITGIEAIFSAEEAPELVVLAEDRLQQARMARRTEVHTETNLAQLARNLAGRLGLTPVITGFDGSIGTWVQLNESDLAFLRRLLTWYDGDLQIVGEELHLSPRAEVQRGRINLELRSQLRRVRVLADLAHQVTKVTVSGWDAQQGQRVVGSSSGSHLLPGTGKLGGQVLQNALGKRPHHISHVGVTTMAEAQAVADAAYDQRARRFVCLEGTAEGNPALRVGSEVNITGLGDRFDNTYYVVQACHRYDLQRGYETDFRAECAYWRG
ncbi:phage late control D family protein [Leptolyngbya sp. AN02str]|uniref:phage late control D family protein n=1 Tax=Leptolyngbya sp. AN02str TaxID=3423363 RepID=UPI003D323B72